MQPAASGVADPLVYDVGAHLGEDTDFYLKLGYRVVAVEANPELAAMFRNRFSGAIADGRLRIVAKAVAEVAGTVTFYMNSRKGVWGTVNPEWAERNARVGAPSLPIAVASIPFETILGEHGVPHYLKVDIEGSDLLCIQALKSFEPRPRYVSIEAHIGDWRRLLAEFAALEDLGYDRFQIVRQGRHRSRTFRSLTGEAFDFFFNEDSSGPFGDDLEGAWLTCNQARRRYRWLWLRERLFSDDSRLGRALAKFPIFSWVPESVGWYDTHAMLLLA